MTHTHIVHFVRRLNVDGTIDSICRHCFVTIATSISESVLEREERKHICDLRLLERYKKPGHSENFSAPYKLAATPPAQSTDASTGLWARRKAAPASDIVGGWLRLIRRWFSHGFRPRIQIHDTAQQSALEFNHRRVRGKVRCVLKLHYGGA
jgi:hypothetical protein